MDNEEKAKVNVLKGINKKIKRKNLIVAIISILTVVLLSIGICWFIYVKEIPIKYEKDMIEVFTLENGNKGIRLNNKNVYASYTFLTSKKNEKGETEKVLYFYMTETIHTKNIHKNKTNNNNSTVLWTVIDFDGNEHFSQLDDNVSKIYYLVADYKKMADISEDKLLDYTKNATLIWSK